MCFTEHMDMDYPEGTGKFLKWIPEVITKNSFR